MSDAFASADKGAAQAAAYAAVNELNYAPTSIVKYESKGHVVVIAPNQAQAYIEQLPDGLSGELFLIEHAGADERISIDGALGQFVVSAGKARIKADLVLDLSPSPVLSMALKPPGYIASPDKSGLEGAMSELEGLIGTFSKPKYFNYDGAICAHGRSGNQGCTRCLDACPAEAIISIVNLIEVDPYRCHGGGICATVCPSGAITYAYPLALDLLKHVRTMLLAYVNTGHGKPELVFVTEAEETRVRHALPGALIVSVEEVASIGPELCLSALAWGARSVRLFDLDEMPLSARSALELNIDMLQAILQTLNLPKHAIALVSDLNELIASSAMPDSLPATFAAIGQKRQAFYMALDHLVEQAENTNPMANLPKGSIFGEVILDSSACTLCMSCVSACPGNALQDGGDLPQLGFVEEGCLQCDICTSTCPEDAISISSRILLDPSARKKRRVLHEEAPFHCISCGAAFATTSGIETIISRLTGHTMFADERALTRLKMCSDCRVKDMMEDPNSDL